MASIGAFALGYSLSLGSYALVQVGLLLVTGWVLFGVSWASWTGMVLVLILVASCAGALTVVVGTFLPSPELGVTLAGPAGFGSAVFTVDSTPCRRSTFVKPASTRGNAAPRSAAAR
ncbi:MAG: hypothetical protein ACRDZN_05495 [Acidimicrobiales bacterium]